MSSMAKLKYLWIVCLTVLAVNAFATSGGVAVSNVAVRIAPVGSIHKDSTLPAWAATNVYAQGTYVRSGVSAYMAVVGGTSGTNAPAGNDDFIDGSVTWRSVRSKARNGLIIINTGTTSGANAYISASSPAEGKGIMIGPNGSSVAFSGDEVPQTAFSAIVPTNGPCILTVFEW